MNNYGYSPEKVEKIVELYTKQKQHFHRQVTDNNYANSGDYSRMASELRDIEQLIEVMR